MVHSSDDDRAGFVKNLCETVYNNDQINGQYNVMVFNLSQDYDKSLNDVVFYGSGSTDGENITLSHAPYALCNMQTR